MENNQQPLQEAKCAEVIEVAFDTRVSLRSSPDVRLTGEPRQKAVCGGSVTFTQGLAVAARRGHKYPVDTWEKCMGYLDKGGSHHPSMSIDIMNKRPTEIDYINGKILERGQMYDDLNLEVNRVLTSLLMYLEVRNGTRKSDEFPNHIFHIPAKLPVQK